MKSKGQRWQEARKRNLLEQIRIKRKEMAFWKKMGAQEKLEQAQRDMISLKSKLADCKSKL